MYDDNHYNLIRDLLVNHKLQDYQIILSSDNYCLMAMIIMFTLMNYNNNEL